MSSENDQKIRAKLVLSVCLQAARFGVPQNVDELRMMRWIKRPDLLRAKMRGLLDFLGSEPDESGDEKIARVEFSLAHVNPSRSIDEFHGGFITNNVTVDPAITIDCFEKQIRPLNIGARILCLTAICFDTPVTTEEATDMLSSEQGVMPASFGQLCEIAITAPSFIRELGMVSATGGEYEHDSHLLIPYLHRTSACDPTQNDELMLSAMLAGADWPANTWFLGVSSL